MTDHAYDAPDITPFEFMRAVMRDQTVEMCLRLRAAEMLITIPFLDDHILDWQDGGKTLVITPQGYQPNIRDVVVRDTCYRNAGIMHLDLSLMPIRGHG